MTPDASARHRIFLVPLLDAVSAEAARDHWWHRHGTLFCQVPGLAGYRQNRPTDASWTRHRLVCSETWFPSREAERGAFLGDYYTDVVIPDESSFVARDRGWVALLRSEDPADAVGSRAAYRTLLFGWAGRRGPGWRKRPDGGPSRTLRRPRRPPQPLDGRPRRGRARRRAAVRRRARVQSRPVPLSQRRLAALSTAQRVTHGCTHAVERLLVQRPHTLGQRRLRDGVKPSQLTTDSRSSPTSSWSTATSAARPRAFVVTSATVTSARTSRTSDLVSTSTGRRLRPTSASHTSPRVTRPRLRRRPRTDQAVLAVARRPHDRLGQALPAPRSPLRRVRPPRCSHRAGEPGPQEPRPA